MALAVAASIHPLGSAQSSPGGDDPCRSGPRLLAEGRRTEALDALRACVARQPRNAGAWATLGAILASASDYEGAEQPFRQACELQPGLPDVCLYYARTLYLLDRFEPALEILRRAPPTAQAFRIRGLCLEALSRTGEAEQSFLEAMRLSGLSVPGEDPAIDYGVFLFRQGRAEAALAPLEDAVKRHPDAARAHLELGCVLLALDRLAEAESHLEKATHLDPQSARAHLLLGKVLMRLGRTEAARQHLDQGSRTVK